MGSVFAVPDARLVTGVRVAALAAIGTSAVTSVMGHRGVLVGWHGRRGLVFHGTLLRMVH